MNFVHRQSLIEKKTYIESLQNDIQAEIEQKEKEKEEALQLDNMLENNVEDMNRVIQQLGKQEFHLKLRLSEDVKLAKVEEDRLKEVNRSRRNELVRI